MQKQSPFSIGRLFACNLEVINLSYDSMNDTCNNTWYLYDNNIWYNNNWFDLYDTSQNAWWRKLDKTLKLWQTFVILLRLVLSRRITLHPIACTYEPPCTYIHYVRPVQTRANAFTQNIFIFSFFNFSLSRRRASQMKISARNH